ncbi:MAG: hypothetical protein ACOWWM_06705 [Desulfobacterales bacterium]
MLAKALRSAMIFVVVSAMGSTLLASEFECTPTRQDAKGPFYEPDAPVRDSVGSGFVLVGKVKSAKDCSSITDARIEAWMAGPDGRYDDAYRATLSVDGEGGYRFQSHFPPTYGFRPPHIHLRITAEGHQTLVTQFYPEEGTDAGHFDLVLTPDS